MPKYLVCLKQGGTGCDYTLGCGMKYYFESADSVDALIEKIIWPDGKDAYSCLEGPNKLINILIIPAEHVTTVNLLPLRNEVDFIHLQRAQEIHEAHELVELDPLQEKYKKRARA